MQTPLCPDDLVIAVLHRVRGRHNERVFPTERERLHSAFFELKQRHPDLFHDFHFRNKGFFYESEELDQALCNLEASRLLHRHNETPKYYFVQVRLDRSYEEFVKGKLAELGVNEGRMVEVAGEFNLLVSGAR